MKTPVQNHKAQLWCDNPPGFSPLNQMQKASQSVWMLNTKFISLSWGTVMSFSLERDVSFSTFPLSAEQNWDSPLVFTWAHMSRQHDGRVHLVPVFQICFLWDVSPSSHQSNAFLEVFPFKRKSSKHHQSLVIEWLPVRRPQYCSLERILRDLF